MVTIKKFRNLSKNSISILTDESRVANDIAMMIHQARVHRGLSQSALAKRLGDTKQTSISRLENGHSLPSISFLLRIAIALDSHLIPPKIAFLNEVISYRKYFRQGFEQKNPAMFLWDPQTPITETFSKSENTLEKLKLNIYEPALD